MTPNENNEIAWTKKHLEEMIAREYNRKTLALDQIYASYKLDDNYYRMDPYEKGYHDGLEGDGRINNSHCGDPDYIAGYEDGEGDRIFDEQLASEPEPVDPDEVLKWLNEWRSISINDTNSNMGFYNI
jgi:hypothetical protein